MKQKLKTHFLMNLMIKATDTNFFSSRSSLKQFLNYLSRKKNNLLSSFFKFNINLETTELAPKYPANLNSKHLIIRIVIPICKPDFRLKSYPFIAS